MRQPPSGDEGFTLIEAVIAIVVMSIAVVTLVGALATLISLAQEHRGHAVTETAARSFGQAVQALAQSPTPLAVAATSSSSSLTVLDASTLPAPGSNSYLMIEREVVRLNAIDRSTGVLTVSRGAGGSTAAAHAANTAVVPFLHCPEAGTLTPDASAYLSSTGISTVVSAVDYWRPSTATFVNRNACLTDYETFCPGGLLLPECNGGLFRVSVTVTSAGDSRLRGAASTTRLIVRSGSV